MSQTNVVPGGWSAWRPLTAQDHQEFNKIAAHLLGVKYTPLLVATKVVAGMEYEYLCTTELVIPQPVHGAATVLAYQPPSGNPVVLGVTPIHP